MVDEKYVALYRKGDLVPVGAIRKTTADSLLIDLQVRLYEHYSVKPISREQALQIVEDITKSSEGVEEILNKK